jgi:hypothetical protein
MNFLIFREMPVGTIFELSGLKFEKVEHSPRPDGEGYYNALQLDIEDGYAWVKEDNLFRVLTPEEMQAQAQAQAQEQKRKKKKRRRGRDGKPGKNDKPGGDGKTENSAKPNNPKSSRPRRRQNRPKPKNT